MQRLGLTLTLVVGATLVGSAGAQPTTPSAAASATSKAAESPCLQRIAPALVRLGCELARQVALPPEVAAHYTVASAPVAADLPPADLSPDERAARAASFARLTTRIARVVASEFPGPPAVDPSGSLEQALAQAAAPYILYLTPRLRAGRIEIEADVYKTRQSFWQRLVAARNAPLRHGFASAPIDAEIASFLPPIPLIATQIIRIQSPTQNAVAVGCGDIDGVGGPELLVVGRHALHVGRIRGGKFAETRQSVWSELTPVAPTPLRDPIATVRPLAGGGVAVGLSDRADAIWFDTNLAAVDRRPDKLPWPGGGCTRREMLGVAWGVSTCEANAGLGNRHAALPPAELLGKQKPLWADAVGGAQLTDRAGNAFFVRGVRVGESNESALVLWQHIAAGEAPGSVNASLRVENVGYAFAVGDLNLDGHPDLIASANTLDPKADVLTTYAWNDDGLEVRAELPAPGGVTAIAICPPEKTGARAAWVAAVGDQVWVGR